ncbi:MAG: FHA domain-containing protein [Akkermansia sp.]|nr:FHA domain-containing protein [Akkermansia sp.]
MGSYDRAKEVHVSEIEGRVKQLERELARARAALTVASSQALAKGRDGLAEENRLVGVKSAAMGARQVLPCSSHAARPEEKQPAILLQPLPMHDSLRRRWRLGPGLPSSGFGASRPVSSRVASSSGQLRLLALLRDGSPWEQFIPFCDLGQEGGVIIGRDPEICEVVLMDESVSRMHARIEICNQGVVVSDMNSTNGVMVNDNPVDHYSPRVPMSDGSVLILGEVPIRVEFITK